MLGGCCECLRMLDGAADGCMDAAWFLRGAADGCMVLQMAALRSAVIIIPYMVRLVTLFLVKWGVEAGRYFLKICLFLL